MLLTNANRLLFTAARRSVVTKLSQRGFAVAATTQIQSASRVENLDNAGSQANLGWLAAAAAMAGATAVSLEDQKADCCGIAGVVGAKGDAR
jgi:hypothetical protein